MGRWVSPYIAFNESVDRLLVVLLRVHARGKSLDYIASFFSSAVYVQGGDTSTTDQLATVICSLMPPPPLLYPPPTPPIPNSLRRTRPRQRECYILPRRNHPDLRAILPPSFGRALAPLVRGEHPRARGDLEQLNREARSKGAGLGGNGSARPEDDMVAVHSARQLGPWKRKRGRLGLRGLLLHGGGGEGFGFIDGRCRG